MAKERAHSLGEQALKSRSCNLYLAEAADCSAYRSVHGCPHACSGNIGKPAHPLKTTPMSYYRHIHNIW